MLSAGHFKHAAGGRFQAKGRVSAPGRVPAYANVSSRKPTQRELHLSIGIEDARSADRLSDVESRSALPQRRT